jgi:hypothetical protein
MVWSSLARRRQGQPVNLPTGERRSLDWRNAAGYARLRGIDRAGLMWEWLRRDPDYIAWHVRASTATRGTDSEPLLWGLHFRRASEPRSARGPDHLACRFRPRDDGRGRYPR